MNPDEEPKKFARLEVIAGYQILAVLDDEDEGVVLKVRRDRGLSMTATLGPWPSTDEGWKAASDALLNTDLMPIAASMDAALAEMSGAIQQETAPCPASA